MTEDLEDCSTAEREVGEPIGHLFRPDARARCGESEGNCSEKIWNLWES